METWYRKSLGDGITATLPVHDIKTMFWPIYLCAGSPADMAVFIEYDTHGHLHCEVTAYFSPAAARMAQILGAEPCPRPSEQNLMLVAGNDQWRDALFRAE